MRDIQELIVELKEYAAYTDGWQAELFAKAADALEAQEETIATFIAANEKHEQNPWVRKYVESWRARTGNSELTFPSADRVYRDYFTLCGELKHVTRCDSCLHWDAEKCCCDVGPGLNYINMCIVPENSKWCWHGPDHLIKAQENRKKKEG